MLASIPTPETILQSIPTLEPYPHTLRGKAVVDTIGGARTVELLRHRDARGELTAFDCDSNLGFALRRVFFIRSDRPETIRAEHACSAEQVLVVLAGAVTIDIDNGREQCTLRLHPDDRALRVSPGVWLRLRNFMQGTLLSVAASRTYADTVYFDRAQPDLIAAP